MKKILILIAVAASALAIFSCEKYDDGRPSKTVRAEFKKMYPGASDVEWEWQGTIWEVSFKTGKRPYVTEHEACYEKEGDWIRTKTEMTVSSVPASIKTALAADATYGTATFADDDADYIETPTGDFYRFNLKLGSSVVLVDVYDDGQVAPALLDF